MRPGKPFSAKFESLGVFLTKRANGSNVSADKGYPITEFCELRRNMNYSSFQKTKFWGPGLINWSYFLACSEARHQNVKPDL